MSHSEPPVQAEPASPCCGICRVDRQRQRCEGCLRTLDEIGRWGAMDREQKIAVLQACLERQGPAVVEQSRTETTRPDSGPG